MGSDVKVESQWPTAMANREVISQAAQETAERRTGMLVREAATVWFTGLPASGKSTLAFALQQRLLESGRPCFLLDGDNVRRGLSRDLGFSPADRRENIRRIAEVAGLCNDAGMVAIVAVISPVREIREMARQIIRPDRFMEIHVATCLEICEQRDPKGLYEKARAGLIADFTGISAAYETPACPALSIDAGHLSVEESLTKVMCALDLRLRK